MRIGNHDIGVCSWSLRANGAAGMIARMRELGVEHVHLRLDDLVAMNEAAQALAMTQLENSGLNFTAGMVGFAGEDYTTIESISQTGGYMPDNLWPARREVTLAVGKLARRLGIKLLTTHIGFVPPSSHEKYGVLLERIREIARVLAEDEIGLLAETGQETPSELLQFLNDVGSPAVGANFDPANVILYGVGDPIQAVRTLGRHIGHVHVKDARASDQPGMQWGREVPFGDGEVGPKRFLDALSVAGYAGPLAIECEMPGGDLAPVRMAIKSLRAAGAASA